MDVARFDDSICSTSNNNNGVDSQPLQTEFSNNMDCLNSEPEIPDPLKTNGTTTRIAEDADGNNKIETNADQKSPFGKFL